MGKLFEALSAALPNSNIIMDAPMREYTSFRTGGEAAALLNASSPKEIASALLAANAMGAECHVIGNGTNLLVSDKGLDALVIRIGERMAGISGENGKYLVSAGAPLSAFAKRSVEDGFMGLEWAAGIPGNVGGAVAMNAGAYGGEIGRALSAAYVLSNGEVSRYVPSEGEMGYRTSPFTAPDKIVVAAEFSLLPDDGGARERMREYNASRKEKQPLSFPSAGSTFKRPEGHFAGALIERAGLKGASIGGARVSELHAGFIINTGGGTSSDIYALIKLVQKKVLEQSGVLLQPEVKLMGDFE